MKCSWVTKGKTKKGLATVRKCERAADGGHAIDGKKRRYCRRHHDKHILGVLRARGCKGLLAAHKRSVRRRKAARKHNTEVRVARKMQASVDLARLEAEADRRWAAHNGGAK